MRHLQRSSAVLNRLLRGLVGSQRRKAQAPQLLEHGFLALELAAQLNAQSREGIKIQFQTFAGGFAEQTHHRGAALILEKVKQDRPAIALGAAQQRAQLKNQLSPGPAFQQQRNCGALKIKGLAQDLLQVAARLGIQQIEPGSKLGVDLGLNGPSLEVL